MVLDTQGEYPYNSRLKKSVYRLRESLGGSKVGIKGSFMLVGIIMLAVAETRGADTVPVESANTVPVSW
jgi:hypothetical protein